MKLRAPFQAACAIAFGVITCAPLARAEAPAATGDARDSGRAEPTPDDAAAPGPAGTPAQPAEQQKPASPETTSASSEAGAPPSAGVQATPSSAGTGPRQKDVASADRLFSHAVGLMKQDRCTEAIPEFLRSQALDGSAATLLNLGTCYARLGRKATAWRTYRRAAAAALEENDEPLREHALQGMAVLEPSLTKLQVVTPPGSPPLSIRINGALVSDQSGLPIPLDPGENVIEAAAPGHEPWRRSITAGADVGATIVVQVPELQPLPVLTPYHPAVPPSADFRIPATIIGGSGLAAIVVGSIFGLSAKSTYDDAAGYCIGRRCTAAGANLRNDARDKAAAATVTVGVGLAAVVAGTVLWLTSPHRRVEQQAEATPQWLWVDARGAALGIEARR